MEVFLPPYPCAAGIYYGAACTPYGAACTPSHLCKIWGPSQIAPWQPGFVVNSVVAVTVDIVTATAKFYLAYNKQDQAYLEQTLEPALPKSPSLHGA